MDVKFEIDESLNVSAIAKDGGSINSQSVVSLLLLAIFDALKEIKQANIDIESAINPR